LSLVTRGPLLPIVSQSGTIRAPKAAIPLGISFYVTENANGFFAEQSVVHGTQSGVVRLLHDSQFLRLRWFLRVIMTGNRHGMLCDSEFGALA